MKKLALLIAIAYCCSSCATIFGGKITSGQRTKPKPGEESRHIRGAALVFDILTGGIWVIVDFADCAIYRPSTGSSEYGGR